MHCSVPENCLKSKGNTCDKLDSKFIRHRNGRPKWNDRVSFEFVYQYFTVWMLSTEIGHSNILCCIQIKKLFHFVHLKSHMCSTKHLAYLIELSYSPNENLHIRLGRSSLWWCHSIRYRTWKHWNYAWNLGLLFFLCFSLHLFSLFVRLNFSSKPKRVEIHKKEQTKRRKNANIRNKNIF